MMDKSKVEKKLKYNRFLKVFLNIIFGFTLLSQIFVIGYLISSVGFSQKLISIELLLPIIVVVMFLYLLNLFLNKRRKKLQSILLECEE